MLSNGLSKGGEGKASVSDLMANTNSSRKSIKMKLNLEASNEIMDKLIDIYTKPIEATVREVVSNAVDATVVHAKNGNEVKPVTIELPTKLSPFFKVQDFGIGMSLDHIENVLATFGGTTKRNDFDQIGNHGLGAKSPLAYVDQFSLETTKDGVTTKAIILRSSTGPETQIISSEYTGLESGTTVTVPVETENDNEKAESDSVVFAKAVETYKNFSFEAPIVVNDTLYNGNEVYEEIGEVVIEEISQTKGKVWVNKDIIHKEVENVIHLGYDFKDTYAYVLSGYRYNSPKREYKDHQEQPTFLIELKPGVVNFVSSRDAITSDNRSSKLDAIAERLIYGNNASVIPMLVKAVQKGVFDYKEAYMIIANMGANVNEYDSEKLDIGNYSFDIDSIKSIDGSFAPFEENEKFNNNSVFGIFSMSRGAVSFGKTNSKLKLDFAYFNDHRFFSDSYAYRKDNVFANVDEDVVKESAKITDINRSLLFNRLKINENKAMGNTILDQANIINSKVDKRKKRIFVYFAKNVNADKKIRAITRARDYFFKKANIDENGYFKEVETFVVLLKDNNDIDEEIEIFKKRIRNDLEVETFIADDDFVDEALNSVKKESQNQKDSVVGALPLNKVEVKLENYDNLLNGKDAPILSSKANYDTKEIYNKNNIFIIGEGVNSTSILEFLNGYQDKHGFDNLKGREIYFMPKTLKKDMLELLDSGEEVVRIGDIKHASDEVEEKVNNLSVYKRDISVDKINNLSNKDLIEKFIDENFMKDRISSIKEKIQNVISSGKNQSTKNSQEIIDFFDEYFDVERTSYYSARMGIEQRHLVDRFGIDSSVVRLSSVMKQVCVYNYGGYNESNLLKTLNLLDDSIVRNKTMPDYLIESLVKFIEEELGKISYFS